MGQDEALRANGRHSNYTQEEGCQPAGDKKDSHARWQQSHDHVPGGAGSSPWEPHEAQVLRCGYCRSTLFPPTYLVGELVTTAPTL